MDRFDIPGQYYSMGEVQTLKQQKIEAIENININMAVVKCLDQINE